MACGARWGLKQEPSRFVLHVLAWLNGLWSPLGIETISASADENTLIEAKWPVEPVGD